VPANLGRYKGSRSTRKHAHQLCGSFSTPQALFLWGSFGESDGKCEGDQCTPRRWSRRERGRSTRGCQVDARRSRLVSRSPPVSAMREGLCAVSSQTPFGHPLHKQRVPVQCARLLAGAVFAAHTIAIFTKPYLRPRTSSYRLGTPAPRHPRRVEGYYSSPRPPFRHPSEEGISYLEPRSSDCLRKHLFLTNSFHSICIYLDRTISINFAIHLHALPLDNAYPRTRQGLLQALPERQRQHPFQDRLHRLPRAMAQQCIQTWRAHAATQISGTTKERAQGASRLFQLCRCLAPQELPKPVLAYGHSRA